MYIHTKDKIKFIAFKKSNLGVTLKKYSLLLLRVTWCVDKHNTSVSSDISPALFMTSPFTLGIMGDISVYWLFNTKDNLNGVGTTSISSWLSHCGIEWLVYNHLVLSSPAKRFGRNHLKKKHLVALCDLKFWSYFFRESEVLCGTDSVMKLNF